MGSEKLVSIIVPVYNAERYLASCLESILKQSHQNLELILINDGSSDGSGLICNDYAEKDSRIKVIHQLNAGPSVARNKGIKAATGEYIQFVDSDDTIDLQMTQRLVAAIGDSDLVICGYRKVFGTQDHEIAVKPYPLKLTGTYTKQQFINQFADLYPNNFIHYNWNKLYVSSIIKGANVSFKTDVDWGEDLLFNLSYIDNCRSLQLIEDTLYDYLDSNTGSITSKFRLDLFTNMQMLQGNVRDFLKRNNGYVGPNKTLFEQFYTDRVMACFWNLFHPNSILNKESKKNQIREIMQDARVRQSLPHFKMGSRDKQFVGSLIERQAVDQLYAYYSLKSFMKKRTASKEKWI